jgi:hypothetical protein
VAYNIVTKEPEATVIMRPIREFVAKRLPFVSSAEDKPWMAKNLSSPGGNSFEIPYNS